MDRDAWCAAIHEVAELDMTEWMNWTELKYVKEILRDLKWETDKCTVMVQKFNNPLATNETENKDIEECKKKKKIYQPIEINSHVFRTVHSKTEDCTFFWGAYKTCQGRPYLRSKAYSNCLREPK